MTEIAVIEAEEVEIVAVEEAWGVLVYCGYSDWFETHDVRMHGPYTQAEAEDFARSLIAQEIDRRDGNGKLFAMPMLLTTPEPTTYTV